MPPCPSTSLPSSAPPCAPCRHSAWSRWTAGSSAWTTARSAACTARCRRATTRRSNANWTPSSRPSPRRPCSRCSASRSCAAFDAMRRRLAARGLHGGKPTLTMTGPIAGWPGCRPARRGHGGNTRRGLVRRVPRRGLRPGGRRQPAGHPAPRDLQRVRRRADRWRPGRGRIGVLRRGLVRRARHAHPARVPGTRLRAVDPGRVRPEARRRDVERAFLQVEQGNEKAQALYRRAGLADAWSTSTGSADASGFGAHLGHQLFLAGSRAPRASPPGRACGRRGPSGRSRSSLP
jgi:hypothetical protein